MALQKVVLEERNVRLEPLSTDHASGLAEAIRDGELWMLGVTLVPHPNDLEAFLQAADKAFAAGKELAFAIIDKASGAIAGSTRFRCFDPAHKRVEIGFTFLGGSWQRTRVNTAAKYLMLEHAFETWGFNRVELLTDALNTKSRAAIARLGAKEEGVLRSHMVMRDGRIRDSVCFSLVGDEWASAKQELERKLAR